jgi:hypothetical protein
MTNRLYPGKLSFRQNLNQEYPQNINSSNSLKNEGEHQPLGIDGVIYPEIMQAIAHGIRMMHHEEHWQSRQLTPIAVPIGGIGEIAVRTIDFRAKSAKIDNPGQAILWLEQAQCYIPAFVFGYPISFDVAVDKLSVKVADISPIINQGYTAYISVFEKPIETFVPVSNSPAAFGNAPNQSSALQFTTGAASILVAQFRPTRVQAIFSNDDATNGITLNFVNAAVNGANYLLKPGAQVIIHTQNSVQAIAAAATPILSVIDEWY